MIRPLGRAAFAKLRAAMLARRFPLGVPMRRRFGR